MAKETPLPTEPPTAAPTVVASDNGGLRSRFSRLGGSRTVFPELEPLLRTLTGAEAALAVNNGAAAILLALSALAADGEVVVSRGELVEIGGGFRVPDVMAQSGAILREVGTTNRTRVADYAAATTPATAMYLHVHSSNSV